MKSRVFVVDDDLRMCRLIHDALSDDFVVEFSREATTVIEKLVADPPDVILLDWKLPDMEGIELCNIIRKNKTISNLPIIMLTGVTPTRQKVSALEMGADDYITKPFEIDELVARIRAVLRRKSAGLIPIESVQYGPFGLDPTRYDVQLKKQSIPVSRAEFDLLYILIKNPGRPLSRQFLLDHVLGYDASTSVTTRTIDVHMAHLRRKLGSAGRKYLQTIKNVGYVFEDPKRKP